jgi:membrane protein DedA with SNARE-associated domain
MQGQVSMSLLVQQPAQSLVPHAHSSLAPHWLTNLGALGLFSVAVIDSSVIPLPLPGSTDLLLLWLVAHSGDPWLLAPCAIAGSILGGYTTWHIGRRGGEKALRHYVPARLLRRIVRWVERHPVLAVFVPALLPPPIPLLPFALASGALGVSRKRFLLIRRMARRDLWTQDRPPLVWDLTDVVNSAALRVRGPADRRSLLRNLEDSRAAQGRCGGETCVAGQYSYRGLNCLG